MRSASSERRTTNWVIPIVLAIFLASAALQWSVRSFSSDSSLRSPRRVERNICIHLGYNRSGAFTLAAQRPRFNRIVGHSELGTWTKSRLIGKVASRSFLNVWSAV
jgi:hypothetical protein